MSLADPQALTFFYPSTEWFMAQPFDCHCGATKCLKRISGARDIDPAVLARYQLNSHISQQKADQ